MSTQPTTNPHTGERLRPPVKGEVLDWDITGRPQWRSRAGRRDASYLPVPPRGPGIVTPAPPHPHGSDPCPEVIHLDPTGTERAMWRQGRDDSADVRRACVLTAAHNWLDEPLGQQRHRDATGGSWQPGRPYRQEVPAQQPES